MATVCTVVPIPAELVKKQSGPLGNIDQSCWGTTLPRSSEPGPWQEKVTGPDADGRYTVERWPIASPPVAPKSQTEREQRVTEYILTHAGRNPDAVNIRAVEAATGIPRASVGRLCVWRQFVEWRESSRDRQIRARPLTDGMLACIPSNSDDPAEIVAANEQAAMGELDVLIEEQRRDMESDSSMPRKPRKRAS